MPEPFGCHLVLITIFFFSKVVKQTIMGRGHSIDALGPI